MIRRACPAACSISTSMACILGAGERIGHGRNITAIAYASRMQNSALTAMFRDRRRTCCWPWEVRDMPFSSWRGIVGMINPTMRPGVTEEVIRLLPRGIGLIPLFLNFRRGSADEFKAMMPAYEQQVAILAEQ